MEAGLGNQSLKQIRINKIKNKFTKRNIEIFVWREELAEDENIPPAFIFKDKNLKKLSNVKSNDDQAKKKIMTILGDTKLTENL
jgi:ribonuclease D